MVAHAQPRQLLLGQHRQQQHSEWGANPTPLSVLYEWHWDSALESGLCSESFTS